MGAVICRIRGCPKHEYRNPKLSPPVTPMQERLAVSRPPDPYEGVAGREALTSNRPFHICSLLGS